LTQIQDSQKLDEIKKQFLRTSITFKSTTTATAVTKFITVTNIAKQMLNHPVAATLRA